jgi:hypothetical protein
MAGIRIEGNLTGNVAEVNSRNELLVALASTEEFAGYAAATAEVDSGSVTGSRLMRDFEVTADYRLRVGTDAPMLKELFPGAALNTTLWNAPTTTMTVTVVGGYLNLNAGLALASGNAAQVSSRKSFPLIPTGSLNVSIDAQLSASPVANNVCEWGLGIASGTSAPTDAAIFRLNALTEFRCVLNTNGTESQGPILDFSALVGIAATRNFWIDVNDAGAEFWIDDVLVSYISKGTGGYAVTATPELPVLLRNYNANAVSVAQVLKVGGVNVITGDLHTGRTWGEYLVAAGGSASQGQTGGTLGTTALYTNSLAIGAGAVATNTTAALGSGLGGQFALQPTLAANTDGVISSYQVPAGTAAVPGKTLMLTSLKITAIVSTVLVGGPVVLFWSLAYGHTSVSLATTETATSKAPRRVPLGIQAWVSAAALWTQADREINVTFDPPIAVYPGEFVQTVAKNVGTVTSSGVIAFMITPNGYFE